VTDPSGKADDETVRAQLQRSNRALRMLSDVNQALIRATEEQALLVEVCRVVVEIGGYRMAWVGLAEGPPSWVARPCAIQGFEAGYLAEGPISWGDAASAESPVASALRTGEPTIVAEIPEAPGFERRDAAIRRGYLSAIVLPLFQESRPLGILKIYSSSSSPFDPDEVTILNELAGDLAFGMAALRARRERDHAMEVLRDTERQLRTLIGGIPDFISRFDSQGRFSYVSPSVARAIGVPAESILGRTPLEVGVSADLQENKRIQESVTRVITTGVAERLEVTFAMPQGSFVFEVRHLPERDDEGRVVSVLGISTDLEARRAAERQRFILNYALDNVVEGIFLMEGDSPAFIYVNQSAADYLGYTRAELTGGMSVIDIDPWWTLERWKAFIPTIRAARRMTIETVHRTRDGRSIPVEITGNVFEHGGREYNMAISRDISERKAAESALRASEAAYRTMVENTPDLIVRWNRSLERVLVNRGFAAAVGKSVESLVGKAFGVGYPESATAALAQVESGIRRVLETGTPEVIELPFSGGGSQLIIQLRLIPERDESGEVVTVLGMGRDITALKQTEAEVRMLTEHAPDAVIRFDRDCHYVYANRAIECFTGAPADAHLRKAIGGVTGQGLDGLDGLLCSTIAAVVAEGTRREIEARVVIAGGNRVLDVRVIPELGEDGTVATALAVVRDITVQRQLEAQLR
jgi:PAS domain S-box-containing protein